MSEKDNKTTDSGRPEGEPHRSPEDKEVVYFEGSPLLRSELGPLLLFGTIGVLLIAIPVLWWLFTTGGPVWWLWLVCPVIGLIVLMIPWIIARTTRYRISNYRIDYERGLLSKTIDTTELWHVDDVNFHQSLLDRMFNVGDITVMSNDKTTPRLFLRGVPNPRPLFESLKQRIIAVKRQRGVIKMDIG